MSASSPIANAALSLSRPWPGMSTSRSRGSDIIAVAPGFGSRRMRIIVSDRVGLCCSMSIFRRSSPMTRIVCGLPGATCLSCERTCTASGTLSSLMIERDLLDLEQDGDAECDLVAHLIDGYR